MEIAAAVFDEELIRRLRAARHIAILTGAGVSAESGIPTFRDAQTGLWANFSAEELATPRAFRADPRRVWEWYEMRREMMKSARPNPAHAALAHLEAHVDRVTLITQNIDGLHAQAGSHDIIELHGNIWRNKCFACHRSPEQIPVTDQVPPRCTHCGGRLRPDVVWFGELLPAAAFRRAESAARDCDVFLSIGTSSVVQPAANLPVTAAIAKKIVVQVNPEPTELDSLARFNLVGKAGEILPKIFRAAWPDTWID
jgi:NAD-dependent deacetylase